MLKDLGPSNYIKEVIEKWSSGEIDSYGRSLINLYRSSSLCNSINSL